MIKKSKISTKFPKLSKMETKITKMWRKAHFVIIINLRE